MVFGSADALQCRPEVPRILSPNSTVINNIALFATRVFIGPKGVPDENGSPSPPGNHYFVARAFFPHCLAGFSVGWVRLDFSSRRPNYSVGKHGQLKDKAQEIADSGNSAILGKYKKHFLYPESVNSIGIYLSVDGVARVNDVYCKRDGFNSMITDLLNDDGQATGPLPDAFFTFETLPGSVFGENSFPLYFFPPLSSLLSSQKEGGITSVVSLNEVSVGSNGGEANGTVNSNSQAVFSADERKVWCTFRKLFDEVLFSFLPEEHRQVLAAFNDAESARASHEVSGDLKVLRMAKTLRFSLRFRYGNKKFAAWADPAASAHPTPGTPGGNHSQPGYRLTDEQRADFSVSAPVAEGSLDILMDAIEAYFFLKAEMKSLDSIPR